jgi:hypothetical protein
MSSRRRSESEQTKLQETEQQGGRQTLEKSETTQKDCFLGAGGVGVSGRSDGTSPPRVRAGTAEDGTTTKKQAGNGATRQRGIEETKAFGRKPKARPNNEVKVEAAATAREPRQRDDRDNAIKGGRQDR